MAVLLTQVRSEHLGVSIRGRPGIDSVDADMRMENQSTPIMGGVHKGIRPLTGKKRKTLILA